MRIIGTGDIVKIEDNRPYLNPTDRPSFRKGVAEKVYEKARQDDIKEGGDGTVRDPHTREVLTWSPGQPRNGVWDMGHVEEEKYSEVHKKYLDGEMSPAEFRNWYNDPANYVPESPSANRSHKHE